MFEIAKKLGYDLTPYSHFKVSQIKQILNGMVSMVDYQRYAKPDIPGYQMDAIRKCLELGFDVDVDTDWITLRKKYISSDIKLVKQRESELWAKQDIEITLDEDQYTLWQLRCIWYGMQLKLNIADLLNPDLGSAKSVLLLENLIDGIHNSDINYTKYPLETLRIMRDIKLKGYDPHFLCIDHLPYSKAHVLMRGLQNGYDLRKYVSEYDSCQMEQILDGLNEGLDISKYAFKHYDARKMYNIRWCMKNGIDISWVDDDTYWYDSRFGGWEL